METRGSFRRVIWLFSLWVGWWGGQTSWAQNPKGAPTSKPLNRSRLYGPMIPSSMQQVFRPPSRASERPQVFNYTQYCGQNDADKHTVYLCVLEDGRIFGGIPPNVDQNDRIIVYLLVRRWLSHLYTLHMTLRSQSTILPSSNVVREKEVDPKENDAFEVKRYIFGPYAQGPLQLTVSRPSIARGGLGRVFATHVIPVNPLGELLGSKVPSFGSEVTLLFDGSQVAANAEIIERLSDATSPSNVLVFANERNPVPG